MTEWWRIELKKELMIWESECWGEYSKSLRFLWTPWSLRLYGKSVILMWYLTAVVSEQLYREHTDRILRILWVSGWCTTEFMIWSDVFIHDVMSSHSFLKDIWKHWVRTGILGNWTLIFWHVWNGSLAYRWWVVLLQRELVCVSDSQCCNTMRN